MLFGVLIAITVPLSIAYVIWMLDIYALSQARLMTKAAVWGICTFGVALVIQSVLARTNLFTFEQITLYSAPILEESLKAALLIYWVRASRVYYAVDGMAYGFAVGTGFGMAEALFYISTNPMYSIDVAVGRVFTISLIHAFTTASVGLLIGSGLNLGFEARARRISMGVVLAVIGHGVFNQIAFYNHGFTLILYGLLAGVGGIAILTLQVKHSIKNEGLRIRKQLNSKLTTGEVEAVSRPDQIAQILTAHKGQVSPKRIQRIQQYIELQAKCSILRENLATTQQERVKRQLAQLLEQAESQLAELQNTLGVYNRVWLQGVLDTKEHDMWRQLSFQLHKDEPTLALMIKLSERERQLSTDEIILRKVILSKTPLFAQLEMGDLEDLSLLLRRHEYEVGDTVIEQGSIEERLFIVIDGSLIMSVKEQEVETILLAYEQYDVFGELGVLDSKPFPASINCVQHTAVYSLHREDFITLVYSRPAIAMEMMRHLVGQVHQQMSLINWIRQSSQENLVNIESKFDIVQAS